MLARPLAGHREKISIFRAALRLARPCRARCGDARGSAQGLHDSSSTTRPVHLRSPAMIEAVPDSLPLRTEARVLFLTAAGDAGQHALHPLLQQPLDWAYLREIGAIEGAHPELGRRIRAADPTAMPAEAGESWNAVERLAGFRMAHLEQRLHDALALLGEARIPVVVLKGAALALAVDRSFQARPMSDVDVLLRPEDAQRAWQALQQADWMSLDLDPCMQRIYARKHHLPPLFDARAPTLEVGLELHTELFSTFRSPFRLDAEAIWRTAVGGHDLPSHVRVPDPEHMLLHCCLHFAWSHLLRKGAWRTVHDIATLSCRGAIDWQRFEHLARATNGASACFWSLRMAELLGGVPMPAGLLASLRPASSRRLSTAFERHFVQEALATEARCPSGHLRRALWVMAMRPRGNGHGSRRPWTAGIPDEDENGTDTAGPLPSKQTARAWAGPGRLLAWAGYLTSLSRAGSDERTRAVASPAVPSASRQA